MQIFVEMMSNAREKAQPATLLPRSNESISHETGLNFLVRCCSIRPKLSDLSVDLLPFSLDTDRLTELSTGIGRAGDEEDQVLMHLICRLILPTSANGLQGSIIVVDCNCRWLPGSILYQVHRAVLASGGDGAAVRAALSRIYVCQCNDVADLQEKIPYAALKLIAQVPSIALILLDSINDFYTTELCQARGSDSVLQQKFAKAATNLQEMAFKLRTPVLVCKRRLSELSYPASATQQQQQPQQPSNTETNFLTTSLDVGDRLGSGYRMRFNQWLSVTLMSLGVSDHYSTNEDIAARSSNALRTMVRLEGLKKDSSGQSNKQRKLWFANIKLLAPFGIEITSKGNSENDEDSLQRQHSSRQLSKRLRLSLPTATATESHDNEFLSAYYNAPDPPTLSQIENDLALAPAAVVSEDLNAEEQN